MQKIRLQAKRSAECSGSCMAQWLVKCLICDPGVLGSSCIGSAGFFLGSVLEQDTSEPKPSTGETQEDLNNVSCGSDMTEILLKVA